MIDGLVYLATPYTHPSADERRRRFEAAAQYAADLMAAGWMIFSPIAHSHALALAGLPDGWGFWERWGRLFLDRCDGMIVYQMPGWEISRGVAAEIAIATQMGKPIEYHAWHPHHEPTRKDKPEGHRPERTGHDGQEAGTATRPGAERDAAPATTNATRYEAGETAVFDGQAKRVVAWVPAGSPLRALDVAAALNQAEGTRKP